MKKLELIIEKINKVPINTRNGKKAKKLSIEYYTENKVQVNNLPLAQIESFDFVKSILQKALNLDKVDYFHKHKAQKIKGLSTHSYAPELNNLVFFDGSEFKTPQITDLPSAIAYLIKKLTLEQIKAL